MVTFIRHCASANDYLSIIFRYEWASLPWRITKRIFTSGTYLSMTINSVWYAFLITIFTLLVSYPTAYF